VKSLNRLIARAAFGAAIAVGSGVYCALLRNAVVPAVARSARPHKFTSLPDVTFAA
jgi:hypothetical protein